MSNQRHADGGLELEEVERDKEITIHWLGRSMAREPSAFITPILADAMIRAQRSQKRLALDFRLLKYLNSSTITPLLLLLEQAKHGTAKLTVRFDSKSGWQLATFSALYLYATGDGRVAVERL